MELLPLPGLELRKVCVLGCVNVVEERAHRLTLSWAVPLIRGERVLVSDIGQARRLDTFESSAWCFTMRAEL
jgi:hypothetical protein